MFRVTGVTLHSVLMNQDGTASHRKVVRDSRDSRQRTQKIPPLFYVISLSACGGEVLATTHLDCRENVEEEMNFCNRML
jgi:hypothetical protein